MNVTVQNVESRISVAERAASAIRSPKREPAQSTIYFCDHPRLRFHGVTKVEIDYLKRRFVQLPILNPMAVTLPHSLQNGSIILTINTSRPIELDRYTFTVNGRIAEALALDTKLDDEALIRVQLDPPRNYGKRTTLYVSFGNRSPTYEVNLEPERRHLDLYSIQFIPEAP
jgi:hypothetical protein